MGCTNLQSMDTPKLTAHQQEFFENSPLKPPKLELYEKKATQIFTQGV